MLGSSYHPAIPTQLTNSITCPVAKHLQAAGRAEQSQRKRQFPNKEEASLDKYDLLGKWERPSPRHSRLNKAFLNTHPRHVYPQIHPARPYRGTSVRNPTPIPLHCKALKGSSTAGFFPDAKDIKRGFPGWLSSTESICQAGDTGSVPGREKIPYASEQLSPRATTTEPVLEPGSLSYCAHAP